MLTKKEKHAYARRQKVRRKTSPKKGCRQNETTTRTCHYTLDGTKEKKEQKHEQTQRKTTNAKPGRHHPWAATFQKKGKKTTQAPAAIEPVTHGGRAAQRGKSSVLPVLHADSPRQNRQVLMHAAQERGRPPAAPPLLKMQDLPA